MIHEEPILSSSAANASELSRRYQEVRTQSARLCKPLRTEDYVVQPIEDVSPPKWHLAHTTWFFEQFILIPHQPDYRVFDKMFNYVFNSYYESMGEKMLRNHRGNMTRPSTEDIYRYREYVDEAMQELMNSSAFTDELAYLAELGLQHEQQHQELLVTDIKFILGNNPLYPAYLKKQPSQNGNGIVFNNQQSYIEIEGGNYPIGFQGQGFHYDNEEGYHQYSPLMHTDSLKSNFLLIHGTADDNVHFQNTIELQNALIAANKQFETFIYPNRDHSISGGFTHYHLYGLINNFIKRNL